MTKIIKEMLPPDVRVARDAQDLLIECCVGKLLMQFYGLFVACLYFLAAVSCYHICLCWPCDLSMSFVLEKMSDDPIGQLNNWDPFVVYYTIPAVKMLMLCSGYEIITFVMILTFL